MKKTLKTFYSYDYDYGCNYYNYYDKITANMSQFEVPTVAVFTLRCGKINVAKVLFRSIYLWPLTFLSLYTFYKRCVWSLRLNWTTDRDDVIAVNWKPSNLACHGDHSPLILDATSPGYLASSVTLATGQGGRGCQWRLRLSDPGQRINFTLFSFFVAGETWTTAPALGGRTFGVARGPHKTSSASRSSMKITC